MQKTQELCTKGFKVVDGKKYYFSPKTGLVSTGWISVDGKKYYIDPSTTTIITGTKLIDGTYYVFDSNGVLTNSYKDSSNSGSDYTDLCKNNQELSCRSIAAGR